ncbi:MAG: undecaprenyl-diphosphate phosphatase [Deltaproteobacteria bacterium]|nr:undecaprenyl-diphosphate phosphatase [Deltaproteobacteria bacterium]
MSEILTALFLGILQGLTEFLPVSSSGHLVLAQALLPNLSQPGVVFEVTLHLGTLVAVCLYFRKDLWAMAVSLVAPQEEKTTEDRRLLWLVILGTLPTVMIGLLFRKQFESMFTDLRGAGIWFVITGLLLFLTDRVATKGRQLSEMTIRDALVIGIAQGLSIIPALSRSGSTIATGILLALDRTLLVRYSFLLSIPAVLGAFILEVVAHRDELLQGFDPLTYGIGTIAAGIVGYWSISVLLNMTRSRRLSVFAYYCIVIGIVAFLIASR